MKASGKLQIQHKCEACEIRSDNFFCNLRDSNFKIFESLKITNHYPVGSTLFMQGEQSSGVYILCKGRIKLYTCSKDGKVIILHLAEPGEVLGLSATVSDSVQIATAEVVESCQVNFVRNVDFLNFLQQNSEACLSAVKQLSQNYHTACLQICSLGLSHSVADKLASLFLGWCRASCDESLGIRLKITYTHEEIAQMIGTSRETVTRLLRDFKERRLISLKGSDLIVHNTDDLEAMIGDRHKSK